MKNTMKQSVVEKKNIETQCKDCEALKVQLTESEESKKRVLADYDNLLKRTREERERIVRMASADVILELLEPLDHLELASAHLKDQGLTMVCAQFVHVLQEQGLSEMKVLGTPFNQETMEAVELVDGDKDIVMRVDKKGYTLNGAVLRHAKVAVGKGQ